MADSELKLEGSLTVEDMDSIINPPNKSVGAPDRRKGLGIDPYTNPLNKYTPSEIQQALPLSDNPTVSEMDDVIEGNKLPVGHPDNPITDYQKYLEMKLNRGQDMYPLAGLGAKVLTGMSEEDYNKARKELDKPSRDAAITDFEAGMQKTLPLGYLNPGRFMGELTEYMPMLGGSWAASTAGAATGAGAGALKGAIVGSAVPGPGTAAGAGVGALTEATIGRSTAAYSHMFYLTYGTTLADHLRDGIPYEDAKKSALASALAMAQLEVIGIGAATKTLQGFAKVGVGNPAKFYKNAMKQFTESLKTDEVKTALAKQMANMLQGVDKKLLKELVGNVALGATFQGGVQLAQDLINNGIKMLTAYAKNVDIDYAHWGEQMRDDVFRAATFGFASGGLGHGLSAAKKRLTFNQILSRAAKLAEKKLQDSQAKHAEAEMKRRMEEANIIDVEEVVQNNTPSSSGEITQRKETPAHVEQKPAVIPEVVEVFEKQHATYDALSKDLATMPGKPTYEATISKFVKAMDFDTPKALAGEEIKQTLFRRLENARRSGGLLKYMFDWNTAVITLLQRNKKDAVVNEMVKELRMIDAIEDTLALTRKAREHAEKVITDTAFGGDANKYTDYVYKAKTTWHTINYKDQDGVHQSARLTTGEVLQLLGYMRDPDARPALVNKNKITFSYPDKWGTDLEHVPYEMAVKAYQKAKLSHTDLNAYLEKTGDAPNQINTRNMLKDVKTQGGHLTKGDWAEITKPPENLNSTEHALKQAVGPLGERVVDALGKVYAGQFGELAKAFKAEYGVDLKAAKNYYGFLWRDVSSTASPEEVFMEMMFDRAKLKPKQVESRTNNDVRLRVSDAFQNMESYFETTRSFMGKRVQAHKLRTVFGNAEVRNIIEERFGNKYMQVLDSHIEDFIHGDVRLNSATDQFYGKLAKNFYPVYLSGTDQMLKQLTATILPLSQGVNIFEYQEYITDFWHNPGEAFKYMHDNSELVRQRGDLLNRELREAKLQVRERGLFKGKLIDKHSSLQDLALSGLRTGDVLSFVQAAYIMARKKQSQGMTPKAAAKEGGKLANDFMGSGTIDALGAFNRRKGLERLASLATAPANALVAQLIRKVQRIKPTKEGVRNAAGFGVAVTTILASEMLFNTIGKSMQITLNSKDPEEVAKLQDQLATRAVTSGVFSAAGGMSIVNYLSGPMGTIIKNWAFDSNSRVYKPELTGFSMLDDAVQTMKNAQVVATDLMAIGEDEQFIKDKYTGAEREKRLKLLEEDRRAVLLSKPALTMLQTALETYDMTAPKSWGGGIGISKLVPALRKLDEKVSLEDARNEAIDLIQSLNDTYEIKQSDIHDIPNDDAPDDSESSLRGYVRYP